MIGSLPCPRGSWAGALLVAVLALYRRRVQRVLAGLAGRDPDGRRLAVALVLVPFAFSLVDSLAFFLPFSWLSNLPRLLVLIVLFWPATRRLCGTGPWGAAALESRH